MIAKATPFVGIRGSHHEDADNILTPVEKYNESHKGWKIVAQAKALKEHFGFGTVFGLIAVFISLATPIAYQSKTNGITTEAINNLAKEQEQSRAEVAKDLEHQTKATNDAVARIEALVNRTVDVSEQNRDELRSMRDSMERRLGLVEQKADSGWNWTVELKNRVGLIEAEIKRKEGK